MVINSELFEFKVWIRHAVYLLPEFDELLLVRSPPDEVLLCRLGDEEDAGLDELLVDVSEEFPLVGLDVDDSRRLPEFWLPLSLVLVFVED